MFKHLSNPAILTTMLASIFWWSLMALVEASTLVELLSALLLPIGLVMLIRWGPGSARNFWGGARLPRQQLTIAVATFAFAVSFQSIWRLAYRWFGEPETMARSHWVSFPTYMFLIGGLLYLLATRDDHDPPTKTLMQIVAVTAMSILLIGAVVRFLT